MSLVLADVEATIVNTRAAFLSRCGMAVTVLGSAGPNADLGFPIATALRALGYTSSSATAPGDGDVGQVPSDREDLFLGVCDLNTLRTCEGRWGRIDMVIGPDRQSLNQLFTQLQTAISSLTKDLLDRYGYGRRRRRLARVNPITTGSLYPPIPRVRPFGGTDLGPPRAVAADGCDPNVGYPIAEGFLP